MKIHFKGLNALRLYAALSVVIQHIMYSPHDWFGVPKLPDVVGRFFINGTDAVHLFFVLSGFLITYLLLREREISGTVSVRKFYVRRVLRIWPLYYTIILLVGLALPLIIPNFENPLADTRIAILMLLFQGNIAFILFYPFPPLEHLWSIAIEEQFYLFIPHIGKRASNLIKVFVTIVVFWSGLIAVTQFLMPDNFFTILINSIRYDTIAIGGLFACVYYYKLPILKWIYHPLTGWLSVISVILMAIFMDVNPDLVYTSLTCVMFGILMLNVSTNDKFALKLDHPLLESGGNLSYSIYMYHPLLLLIYYSFAYERLDYSTYQLTVYPVIIVSTFILSWLSYRYFESPFLRLKDTFKVAR
ncbi:MAG: acyltransferase [Anaerolineae bacterium]|nr:acyltransferase [Anaerolineae bacterium]